jgi:hypothetical protein
MSGCVRTVLLLAAVSLPAPAAQVTGQIVGTSGESDGARFGVLGATQDVDRTAAVGTRFGVAPLAPSEGEKIFRNGFD